MPHSNACHFSRCLVACFADDCSEALQSAPSVFSALILALSRQLACSLQEFLNTSQLTYHGLAALHEGLQPGALAVFFRNNHFNVLTKVCSDAGQTNGTQSSWLASSAEPHQSSCTYSTDSYNALWHPMCVMRSVRSSHCKIMAS